MKPSLSLLSHCLLAGAVALLAARSGLTLDTGSSGEREPSFAIICFPGPPASDNRVEHYKTIRRANFNLVLPSYRYDDEQQLQMLEHCRATGLRGVVNVKRLAPPASEGPPPPDWKERVRSAAEGFGRHSALYGYMVRDEPSAQAFSQLGRVAREFRRVDPAHDVLVNLFPIYASQEQLGTASYEQYLDEYLSTVKPPVLCYDHYPFLKNGKDRRDYFENLEVARRVCLKHNTPLWIVVLSGWWEHFRTPTDAELRWQAYGALAYGVRGIAYFAFWPVKENYAAAVDYAGSPQPTYDSLRRLNGELAVLGGRLATMQSVGVYHVGREIPAGCKRLASDCWFGVSGDPPLAIGLFESREREKYALVMNRNRQGAETASLELPPGVTSVSLVDAATDRIEALPLQRNACQVVIPAGTGLLLSIE